MKREPSLKPYESGVVEALTEFRDVLSQSEGKGLDRYYTVREVDLKLEPQPYDAKDVKAVRHLLKVSQTVFAKYLGTSVVTVRSWEQGKRPPSPIACRFMDEITANPEHYRGRLRALSQVGPSRALEHCQSLNKDKPAVDDPDR